MATTTLLQRHAGEGETIAEAIRDCLDYGKDPEKTESGKYISAYECDPATVADEFLLAKASYAAMTGREQKKENDVLCYQIRQSFYPGEITRRRRTVSAMSWLCAGRRGDTLLSLPRIPTSSTSIVTFITTPLPLTAPGNSETFGAPASPSVGSLTGCALKTGYPSWRTRSPGARVSIGIMENGRKNEKDRFPIRTGCASPLILRWRSTPLIWTNFSI